MCVTLLTCKQNHVLIWLKVLQWLPSSPRSPKSQGEDFPEFSDTQLLLLSIFLTLLQPIIVSSVFDQAHYQLCSGWSPLWKCSFCGDLHRLVPHLLHIFIPNSLPIWPPCGALLLVHSNSCTPDCPTCSTSLSHDLHSSNRQIIWHCDLLSPARM